MRRKWLFDLFVLAGFLAGGVYLLVGLWLDPGGRHLRDNQQDQVFFEWMLAHGAQVVSQGVDPLFTDQLNAPYGVNLMANTSVLAAAVPLTPLTLAAGPGVSFLVMLTIAPAATAAAWFHVLSRHLVASRLAAVVGGGFCGFAPGMVSHAIGHPNICAQFLVPFIVLAVLRLRNTTRPVRAGLGLAGLIVCQAFLNEEVLFLTAVALGVFTLAYARQRPDVVRRALRPGVIALGVGAATSGALLAYPLAVQFFGRQAYHGLPTWTRFYGAFIDSYPAYSAQSVAGSVAGTPLLSQGPTEQNAFFGWGLCLLVVLVVGWGRRTDPLVLPLGVTAGVFAVCSLGSLLILHRHTGGIPGPWWLLSRLPLFGSVIPTRLALVVTALVGVLLALFIDRVPGRQTAGLVALALLPLVPVPLRTMADDPPPRFFTSGDWRRHIPDGGTVLVAKSSDDESLPSMRWQLATGLRYRVVGGYFLGPEHNVTGRRATLGADDSATADLLSEVAGPNPPRPVDAARADAVRAELRAWRVDTVVLAQRQSHADAIRTAFVDLLGPGERVGDVWVWRPAR